MLTTLIRPVLLVMALLLMPVFAVATDRPPRASCAGVLRDEATFPVSGAVIELHAVGAADTYSALTGARGVYRLEGIQTGKYSMEVKWQGKTWTLATPVDIAAGAKLALDLELSLTSQALTVLSGEEPASSQGRRWPAPFGRTSLQPAPEQARLQPTASPGRRDYDGH